MPTRVLWTSGAGVEHPEALLADDDTACILRPTKGASEHPAILLDFGSELHGGLRLDVPAIKPHQPARLRVRFGESASEAMGTPNQDHAIHDTEILVATMGHTEVGCTGFRFARVDLLEPEAIVNLRAAKAVFLYRNLEYHGNFECDDERLNRVWSTGAYTVHLCMQDFVWDGIKRDRWVWIGDLHPEAQVISTVFGEHPIVPASLDQLRDRTPLPGWMNGISSYSLWWILLHRDWYRYHGNLSYLREQRAYLLGLLDRVAATVDIEGMEHLDGRRFLEWPTSEDPVAMDAGLQALVTLSLQGGAWLCEVLGEKGAASRFRAVAERASRYRRAPTPAKQANALAVLAGMCGAEETNRAILAVDPHRGLSTFYGYYVLQARAMAGDTQGCLDLLRAYWGGMLDLGATTFWEGFDLDWTPNATRIDELPIPGRPDIHADFGNWCYQGLRHSLCHGWAAGPTAWLTEHVLGLSPATPGFARLTVAPHLGDLQWARGTLPTPKGLITVEHERRSDGSVNSKVTAPEGVVGS
jgi:hypothetical protein